MRDQECMAAEANMAHVDLSSLKDEICSEEFKREKQVDDDIVIPEEEEFKISDSQLQE